MDGRRLDRSKCCAQNTKTKTKLNSNKNTLFCKRLSHSASNMFFVVVVVEIITIMIVMIKRHYPIIVQLMKLIVSETINLHSSKSID